MGLWVCFRRKEVVRFIRREEDRVTIKGEREMNKK